MKICVFVAMIFENRCEKRVFLNENRTRCLKCTWGGRLWFRVATNGVAVRCFSGGGRTAAAPYFITSLVAVAWGWQAMVSRCHSRRWRSVLPAWRPQRGRALFYYIPRCGGLGVADYGFPLPLTALAFGASRVVAATRPHLILLHPSLR